MMQEQLIQEIQSSFSPARIGTYLTACNNHFEQAVQLYMHNTHICALFWPLLSFTEVLLRNRITHALKQQYGFNWPSHLGFQKSLSEKQRQELIHILNQHAQPDKITAALKFHFWQKLLTKRFDHNLWKKHLFLAFPQLDANIPFYQHRNNLYAQIEQIRELRNRIAHHEPVVFQRDLPNDYHNIMAFFAACQSPTWMVWLQRHQTLTALLPRITQG